MIVFFDPTVSDQAVSALLSSVESVPGVVDAGVVTHEATLAELEEIFAESPELLETLSPAMVPASIRLRVDRLSALDEVEDVVEFRADVQEFLRGEDVLSPEFKGRMTSDQLQRWCSGED